MSKSTLSSATVKWPGKEWAIAFLPHNATPFESALVGITNPFPDYQIIRGENSAITVFEYVLEGEGEVLLDGEWRSVKAGDTYILRRGEPQHYRSKASNPMKKIWINYVASFLLPLLDSYGVKSGIYRSDSTAHHFTRLLELAESGEVSPDVNFSVAECVYQIIHAVSLSQRVHRDDEYRIREALAARVYEKLNLDELASSLHMSKSQIIRTFKRFYSSTPYEYFLELKMEAAKVLLRDTKMQVKEISEKLSICDEHYFSALFHTRVGVTPRQYRHGKEKA